MPVEFYEELVAIADSPNTNAPAVKLRHSVIYIGCHTGFDIKIFTGYCFNS
jgi:hypothetical protein